MIISERKFTLATHGLTVVATAESTGLHDVRVRRGHQQVARGIINFAAEADSATLMYAPESSLRDRPTQTAVEALTYLAATLSPTDQVEAQPKNLHVDVGMAAGDAAVRGFFENVGYIFPTTNEPRWREPEVATLPASAIHEQLGNQFPPEFTMAGMGVLAPPLIRPRP